ncbi:MAG: hypothetical protein V3T54_04810 [Acidobacteriota bacterium]
MACSFGIDHYRDILKAGQAGGYRFIPYEGLSSLKKGERACILRHDIDYMPEWSARFGEIERELGITATYFFQVAAKTYNLREATNHGVVRALYSAGHGIGLHLDVTWKEDIRWEEIPALCEEEKGVFKAITGIPPCEVVSFHNPHRFRDRVLSCVIPGIRHTYEPPFFSEIKYLSDSQGWQEGCMCRIFGEKKYERIQLLIHPYIWPEQTRGDFIEDVAGMIKLRTDELTEYLLEYHPVCRRDESRLRRTLSGILGPGG